MFVFTVKPKNYFTPKDKSINQQKHGTNKIYEVVEA